MTDLGPAFNGFLKKHEAPPLKPKGSFDLGKVDEFLKEAYRIVSTPVFCSEDPYLQTSS